MTKLTPTELYEKLRDFPGTAVAEASRASLADCAFSQTYGKGLNPEGMEDLWQDLTAVLLNLENGAAIGKEWIDMVREHLTQARMQK